MNFSRNTLVCYVSAVTFSLSILGSSDAQSTRKKKITRVFWQDREKEQLSYADLATTDKWHINRGFVAGFPKPVEGTSLGPMTQMGNQLAVTVRGENGDKLFRIDSGVYEQPHGNHFHWQYERKPGANLNIDIGDKVSSLVTDKNGYFCSKANGGLVAVKKDAATNAAVSFKGGGPDCSFIVVNSSVAYMAWPNSVAENAGRVDVVSLRQPTNTYSFKLQNGGIRSVVSAGNKVFFATESGLSWVNADQNATLGSQQVRANNIAGASADDLGGVPSDFTTDTNSILFTITGKNSLFMINAASQNPTLVKLDIDTAPGLVLSNPAVKVSLGKKYAFLFQERVEADSQVPEQLVIVELDPNRDQMFTDARIKSAVKVGNSKIDGKNGHHHICFDAYGRFAIFTDPGDGIINIMTLNDFKIRAKFRVKGTPDQIVAVGSPEHFH